MNWIKRLLLDDDGPTAVEYAVMLALIVVVALAAIRSAGSTVNATFDDANTKIQAAAS